MENFIFCASCSSLNEDGHARAFLTCLSKAFDCLDHDLLIAKLNAYGVERESLHFYVLTFKTENKGLITSNANTSYNRFSEIISGVSQGSILRLPVFNIYICVMFCERRELDIASYTDDSTP